MTTPEAVARNLLPETKTTSADAPHQEPAGPPTDELAEGTCREFEHRAGTEVREGFLVRSGRRIHAYRNACPHTGAPLNWQPDRFLTEEGDYIVCALHGALFRIEDGLCVSGPCRGLALDKLPVPGEEDRAVGAK